MSLFKTRLVLLQLFEIKILSQLVKSMILFQCYLIGCKNSYNFKFKKFNLKFYTAGLYVILLKITSKN